MQGCCSAETWNRDALTKKGKRRLERAVEGLVSRAIIYVLFVEPGWAKPLIEASMADMLLEARQPKLLIVDKLGYLPFERHAAHLFFQLVSRRYERGSIMVTSNRSVGEWGEVYGDVVVATADPRPAAAPQPRADDHGGELPAAREAPHRRPQRPGRDRGAAGAGLGVSA